MATKECNKKDDVNEVRPLHSASLAGDAVPKRVLVAPWGQVESSNGGFIVDAESVRAAVSAFEQHGTDLPIDYEHQTLGGSFSSPTGKAPAAGWIKRLVAESGVGLLAEIEWTEQAKQMLSAKEYRYLSPVAIIRKSDRKLVGIHSVALTNKPAIVGMRPIVNRAGSGFDEASEGPLTRLRTELELKHDAEPQEVLVAASERLAELEQDARQRHVAERVREAMRAGKLVEAQRAWAEALVVREEDLFDEWFRTAPVVVQTGASAPPERGDGPERRLGAVANRARAEFRAEPFLAELTTEEAYVADAVRAA